MHDSLKDIVFGSTAGIISEVFEYPFDLAKVRLQSQLLTGQKQFKGPIDCLVKTYQAEGITGLYRGLPVPLVGSTVETAAIFCAYSTFKNLIHHYTQQELTIPQLGLASAGAGAVTSFLLTPIELVKCKIQVQMMNTHTPPRIPPVGYPITSAALSPLDPPHSKFLFPATSHNHDPLPGPFSIIRNILKTNGIRGLWLGHTGTLLRETGGTASWFAMKEYVARLLIARHPPSPSPPALLPWESALAGSVSGAFCVAALYPADTVKSVMQTEEELLSHRASTATAAREWAVGTSSSSTSPTSSSSSPSQSKPKVRLKPSSSFLSTFVTIYRSHGFRGLYSGCGMTMARAVPSSGIVFLVYDGLVARFG
ncbi:hypothetical protein D9758_009588 [Tetrapyrgos nigripes]|uniref:Mitochondrial carrier n=1 Tax=Tetrapyrgos nigripes TaxID=182062 RepID=A0A8H5GD73_9AGAR|nr:hypothetical protein D9758_009588 [Tetrapyrgos nigripes]